MNFIIFIIVSNCMPAQKIYSSQKVYLWSFEHVSNIFLYYIMLRWLSQKFGIAM